MTDCINEQNKTVVKFEDEIGTRISKDLKKYQDEYRKKDEEVKKLRKKGTLDEANL